MALSTDKPLIRLLRDEKIEEFNKAACGERPDLVNANLRALDLRRADLSTADLRGAYFRVADLRGLDLSGAQLDGASLHEAMVSGVLFPPEYSPEEIRLSLEFGTRLRPRTS